MKKYYKIIVLMFSVVIPHMNFAASGLISFAKSIGSPKFWQGMGRSFGAPPKGYVYNFQVYNDSNVKIHVAQEGMASFMGGAFPSAKGLYGKKTLPSLFDAPTGSSLKAAYNQADYYFNLYISSGSDIKKSSIYEQAFTQVPLKQHDSNIYYYHVYTGKNYDKGNIIHAPKVEVLGYANPSGSADAKGSIEIGSQLSTINFYNNSHNNVQMTFNYGPTPYTITLEKYSCNSLTVPTKTNDSDSTSTPLFSLRPNTLNFSVYNKTSLKYEPMNKKLNLSADGFNGYTYTIELFDDGHKIDFCMQGLSAGNYDQMVSARVRDITPCPCTLWYQSVAQTKASDGYIDLPGQIWIAYPGADSMVISQVKAGQVVSWNLIRPLIDQHDQYIYFIYVATLDDGKAKKFVEKIMARTLGKDQIAQYDTAAKTAAATTTSSIVDSTVHEKNGILNKINLQQQSQTLQGALSVSGGYIQDTEQDICGYIVGMDIFTPKGLGNGNYYYTLAPSVLSVANIVQLLSSCIDGSKISNSADQVQKVLTSTVNTWLQEYLKDSTSTANKVQDYLIQHGNSSIVAAGALTKFGQSQVKALLQGPISLKYPPMKLSTVTNHYVYDFGKTKPDKIPETVTPLQIVTQI